MKLALRNKPFICNSHDVWESTAVVKNQACVMVQMGDLGRYAGPIILSQYIVFDQCDKNFVYYHMYRDRFPLMKSLVLNSHPCEPSVVRFLQSEASHGRQIVVTQRWSMFVRRWGDPGCAIRIMPDQLYAQLIPDHILQRRY